MQFGRPIARFQAVRHRLADALVAVEALEAALAAAREQPSPETAALAKALAGRSVHTVARHCQQVLAGIGLYGVLSTLVRQRTAEIGVRMAFGASSSNILQLVAGQGMKLSVLGIVPGLVTAFAVTRVMSTMLVGVSPTDPLTFAAIAAFFLGVTALACWIPARRAARLDPVAALREE